MKKLLLILFSLMAVGAFSAQAVDKPNWGAIAWLGDGAGSGLYSNKYKTSISSGTFVNIQPREGKASIYYTLPDANIGKFMVDGTEVALETAGGAQFWLPLELITLKETCVEVYNGDNATVKSTVWVYYEDGTASGGGDPTAATNKVYFNNAYSGWPQVYVYAWGDNGDNGDIPGVVMTQDDGTTWSAELDENFTNCIFSSGVKNPAENWDKTSNLTVENNATYEREHHKFALIGAFNNWSSTANATEELEDNCATFVVENFVNEGFKIVVDDREPYGYRSQATVTLGEWFDDTYNNSDQAPIILPSEANGQTVRFTVAADLNNLAHFKAEIVQPAPVWYGTVDGNFNANNTSHNVYIEYNITYNADKTLTIVAQFDCDMSTSHQFCWSGVEEYKNMTLVEGTTNTYTYTTIKTAEPGQNVNFWFDMVYAGGVWGRANHVNYVAGSSNEPISPKPLLNATLSEITAESANIHCAITLPPVLAGATVKILLNDTEAPLVDGVISLTDLAENTHYTYTLKPVATLNGTDYEGREVTIEFTTPAADARDYVYHGYLNYDCPNVWVNGMPATSRHTVSVGCPYTVTLQADGNVKYNIDYSAMDNFVGVVAPQIWRNGFHNMTREADGTWSIIIEGPFNIDDVLTFSHYRAYSDGKLDTGCTTKLGTETDPVVVGAPASASVVVTNTLPKVNEEFFVFCSAKDANKNNINAGGFEASFTGLNVVNGVAKCSQKGEYTLVAKIGDISSQYTIRCLVSEAATNLIKDAVPSDHNLVDGGKVENNDSKISNLYDGNKDSICGWNTVNNESDDMDGWFVYDFGTTKAFDMIRVYWQGAMATHYTVEVSSDNENWTVVGEEKGGHAEDMFYYNSNLGKLAVGRYVKLHATHCNNHGWGVKIRELAIWGYEYEVTNPTFTFTTDKFTFDPDPAKTGVTVHYSIAHSNFDDVKHYDITVYEVLSNDVEMTSHRASANESVVANTKHDDMSTTSGTITVPEHAEGQIVRNFRVEAKAVLLDGSEATPENATSSDIVYEVDTADPKGTTGIDNVTVDNAAEAVYYNLQGQRVVNATKGIFIRVQGGKASKVVL